MIGQDYFDLRSRLGTALYSLKSLAAELGAGPDQTVMIDNLVHGLRDPFVFVVVGEVNVGKSTFLNALFGADLSKTGVVPTTDKIFVFKHGNTLRHVPVTPTLEEVYAPVDILRDFHIVDTPGTNTIADEHQEITERFVPLADMVIFVFSAMNPWGASTWQFLDKVHREWMRHVIFVLQQADLRTPEEIGSIQQYMAQLCRQRFGRAFPVFPVSAKRAYMARNSGLDRDRLLEDSGFKQLESHISGSIGGGGGRAAKLSQALRIAQDNLAVLSSEVAGRVAARERKGRVLMDIEAELVSMERRTREKLLPAIDATEHDFMWLSDELMKHLDVLFDRGLAFECAFKEKRQVRGIERILREKLEVPTAQRWNQASAIVEDDMAHAAEFLSGHMTQELRVQMHEDLRHDSDFWEAHRRSLVARIGSAVEKSMEALGIEQDLADTLNRSRKLAAMAMAVIFGSTVAAVILALSERWPVAGAVMLTGWLAGLGLWSACGHLFSRSRRSAATKLAMARPELRRMLEEQTRENVAQLYGGFGRIMQPTQEKLQEQRLRQIAQQESLAGVAAIFQELDVVLADLLSRGGD